MWIYIVGSCVGCQSLRPIIVRGFSLVRPSTLSEETALGKRTMKKINPKLTSEDIPAFPDDADNFVVRMKPSRRHAISATSTRSSKKYGIFKLKQTIADGLQWPYDCKFIPQTLAQDGDPIDIVFLCEAPTFSGCLVEARVIGIIELEEKRRSKRSDRRLSGPSRTAFPRSQRPIQKRP